MAIRTDAEEIARLRQALWDIYGILGFDTDGDPTPAALVTDIVPLVVNAAKEFRQDHDALNADWLDRFGL